MGPARPVPGGLAVDGALADVLPAVADLLGAPARPAPAPAEPSPLTAALREAHDGVEQVCVLLVDGLGERLLAARGGHAPRLRSLTAAAGAPGAAVLAVGYPSTTATSTASLGTGLHPGQHGVLGYQVRDPATGSLFNELSWELAPGAPAGAAAPPDPRRWQRHPTVFEHLAAADVDVTRVGPGFFDGSGLTEATSRGGRFRAATSLPARVDAGLGALRAAARARRRAFVHVYWGDLDKAGHTHGWTSPQWSDELERVDAAVADLVAGLPPRAVLLVTGDHGMVDVPDDARWDVAVDAELAAGVDVVAGEPRAPQLHCAPGALDDVLATWRARLGHVLEVLSREEAIEAGWFGPHGVDAGVLERAGDVVAAAIAPVSVHDSRVQRPELEGLIGMHGGRSPDEVLVPLLVAGSPRRR
ncbi:alkaline phosphatase family protein [Quadrisphaera granulorum]|uniref:alkaline phosphatase family protein n=1 Tax=Quadrisphaera granulorum TaxID=317664 RepID=UPI000D6CBD78|nr:nucleotide pyrophosphatase/phosphodiesterase family protein [Quadrisphaera granulorum]